VESSKLANYIAGHSQPLGFLFKRSGDQVQLWTRSTNSASHPGDWQGADGSTTVPFILVNAGKHLAFDKLKRTLAPAVPIQPEESALS
jgi:hypothetical protein